MLMNRGTEMLLSSSDLFCLRKLFPEKVLTGLGPLEAGSDTQAGAPQPRVLTADGFQVPRCYRTWDKSGTG